MKDVLTVIWSPAFGGDPELFVANPSGEVLGAEKVIPKDGISVSSTNKIVLDGVQLELHIAPSTCRATIGNSMRAIFAQLKKTLDGAKLSASFAPVVEVSKKEMDSLSDAAKQLGCAPSLNNYNPKATIKVAKDFRTRSAGGHIHIGMDGNLTLKNAIKKDPKDFVSLMDLFVGLPSVMMDRDPSVAERRKTYGRAGEYRLPTYGLEYRTLDNFWLRSYQLTSLVFGLSKLACNVYTHSCNDSDYRYSASLPVTMSWNPMKDLLNEVNLKKVEEAINTNNYDLAKELWSNHMAKFIREHVPQQSTYNDGRQDFILPLDASNIDDFQYFCDEIHKKGIERWFPHDPMTHWTSISDGHGIGWESYMAQVVKPIRKYDQLETTLMELKKGSK